jgi:NADPH-dependent curcumin reductase CurA
VVSTSRTQCARSTAFYACANTVVVPGAAGAVGTMAGQIAKIKGCRVVGIAGGATMCAHIAGELGFDTAIDRARRSSTGSTAPDALLMLFRGENMGKSVLKVADA